MRLDVRRIDELTAGERAALQALSAAVYPPDVAASWPGRAFEWSSHDWCVVYWDAGGQAVCYVGAVLRDGMADGRAVKIGGIGGVKTHPQARRQGLASQAVGRAAELFRDEGVDFGLLVCEPPLVPFYGRLGWQPHAGGLVVRQHGRTVPFTFNLPMTCPVRNAELPGGVIDLMGPPW